MRVHFIEKDNLILAYFPNSKRFFKVNNNTKKLIQHINEQKSDNFICSDLTLSKSNLIEFKNTLNTYNEKIKRTYNLNGYSNNKKILNRLVIHVANACNLKCKYCYANGGNYKSDESFLTKNQADKILDKFFNEFDVIEGIQFFGGEPLLNLELIEYICEKINLINKKRNTKTILGLITNGTLINDDFINIVKKYNIHITISYDGNKYVNDLLRVYPNGLGTSDIILNNLSKLKSETGQPELIEGTYTQYHVDNNISVLDIVKHINDSIPDTPLHLVPAGGDSSCDFALKNLEAFKDIKTLFKENIDTKDTVFTYSLFQRIVNSISNKEYGSDYICSAGIGTLSVSVEGDVYPCFMFTDMKDVLLGNVNDENLFISKKYIDRLQKMHDFNLKLNNDKCNKCFINTLCTSCLGSNLLNCGDIYKLDNNTCEMFKEMTENILIEFAKSIDNNKDVI